MPEGDTVWQTATRLAALAGEVVTVSDFRVPSLATRDLTGREVLGTATRGKHLLTRFEGGVTLHSHLRMEGQWAVHPLGSRWRRPAYQARVVLRTAEHEAVGFDIVLDLVATDAEEDVVGHLGPDLLDPDWDDERDVAEAVRHLAGDPDAPIGEALLEQRHLAGIGNVYRCELCFVFGLDPRAPVRAVPDLERMVRRARQMLHSNRNRTIRNTTGDTRPGRNTWVYGRRGPCRRCGTTIRYEHLGPPGRERPTYWCPSCQPPVELA